MTSTWKPSGAGAREVKQAKWKFQDTVVLITGASQGQGRSHAEAFAHLFPVQRIIWIWLIVW